VRQTARRRKKRFISQQKEFAMLRLMAENPGTNQSLAIGSWMLSGATAHSPPLATVDNHVASLRGKIEPNPDEPRWIKTVHGVGYKLTAPIVV